MMNFADIRQDNYYYVDKTRFIPMIEEADRFFFFIRPRRFGKSLTLNLLRQYYDVRTRDKFEALFGDLYIGQHPTPSRNSYLVLHLNFSGIGGGVQDYRRRRKRAAERLPQRAGCALRHYFRELLQDIRRPPSARHSGRTAQGERSRGAAGLPLSGL